MGSLVVAGEPITIDSLVVEGIIKVRCRVGSCVHFNNWIVEGRFL